MFERKGGQGGGGGRENIVSAGMALYWVWKLLYAKESLTFRRKTCSSIFGGVYCHVALLPCIFGEVLSFVMTQ